MEEHSPIEVILKLIEDGSICDDEIVKFVLNCLPDNNESRKSFLCFCTNQVEYLAQTTNPTPILFELSDIWLKVCQSAGDHEEICYAKLNKAKIFKNLCLIKEPGFDQNTAKSLIEDAISSFTTNPEKYGADILPCLVMAINLCEPTDDIDYINKLFRDLIHQAEKILRNETAPVYHRVMAWIQLYSVIFHSMRFHPRLDKSLSFNFDDFYEKYQHPYLSQPEFKQVLLRQLKAAIESAPKLEKFGYILALARIACGSIPLQDVLEYYDSAFKMAQFFEGDRFGELSFLALHHFVFSISTCYQRHDIALDTVRNFKRRLLRQRFDKKQKLRYFPIINLIIFRLLKGNNQLEMANRLEKRMKTYLDVKEITFDIRFEIAQEIVDLKDRLGQNHQAFRLLLGILQEAQALDEKVYEHETLYNLAYTIGVMGDESTKYLLLKLLLEEIRSDPPFASLKMMVLVALSGCEIHLGELKRAITYGEEALSMAESLSDPRRQAESLGNLFLANSWLDDLPKALDCLEKGLNIALTVADGKLLLMYCLDYYQIALQTNDQCLFKRAEEIECLLPIGEIHPFYQSVLSYYKGVRMAFAGQHKEAVRKLIQSLRFILKIRGNIKDFEFRTKHRSTTDKVYAYLVQFYYTMLKDQPKGSAESLLTLVELTKCRGLLELLIFKRMNPSETTTLTDLFADADLDFAKILDQLDSEDVNGGDVKTALGSEIPPIEGAYSVFSPISFKEARQILNSF